MSLYSGCNAYIPMLSVGLKAFKSFKRY